MDLDAEFEKIYGGGNPNRGEESPRTGLDAEFDRLYGDSPDAAKDGGAQNHDRGAPKRKWEEGDGGAMTMPEGEANEWGGNLRNEGRRVLLRRGKDGKVNGYSTTSSMIAQDQDGRYAVIPTVVDGQELSTGDAVKRYAETGEHWGKADNEDDARKMAEAVHTKGAELNQKQWNDWIHEHWDDVSDEIRNDRGTAYEHKKRTAPDTVTLTDRLANGDIEDDLKRKADANNFETVYGSGPMGVPVARGKREKRKYDEAAQMDDMAELAKESGLADWQVKRIRSESKTPDEMRDALKYVAGNRLGAKQEHGEERKTGQLENLRNAAVNVYGGIMAGANTAIGTILGGESKAKPPVMVNDPMAKEEGETFDKWYERVGVNPKERKKGETPGEYARRLQADPQMRKAAEQFFRWEAPIAGKEGMHPERTVMSGDETPYSEKTLRQRMADAFLQSGMEMREHLERKYPVGRTESAIANWVTSAASGVGEFAVAGALMVPMSAAESYQNTRAAALQSGKNEKEATAIGAVSGLVDGVATAAFYAAPFRRWMNGRNIVPVQKVSSGSFKDMARGMGRYFAKMEGINQGIAAAEASGIMAFQGGADEFMRQLANGEEVNLGKSRWPASRAERTGLPSARSWVRGASSTRGSRAQRRMRTSYGTRCGRRTGRARLRSST